MVTTVVTTFGGLSNILTVETRGRVENIDLVTDLISSTSYRHIT